MTHPLDSSPPAIAPASARGGSRAGSQAAGSAPRQQALGRRNRIPRQRPVRLLHRLDGLFTQASLARRSSGVNRRRQQQRLALTQRLLEPLPPELVVPGRDGRRFWQGLRWATLGLVLAWLLRP